MNDFEYDSMQKKRIARSARAQKKGSKSRKCTLPSDYLTESQKRKLNGEVMTYQINKPISWAEFKKYPIDIQKKYLESFAKEHHCTLYMMEEMFGCGHNALRSHIQRRVELQDILPRKGTPEEIKSFRAWLETERGGGNRTRTERSGNSNGRTQRNRTGKTRFHILQLRKIRDYLGGRNAQRNRYCIGEHLPKSAHCSNDQF